MASAVFPLTLVAMIVALTATIAFTPTISTPTTPLGVRVPKNHLDDPAVTRALRNFRRIVLVTGAIAVLVTLAAWNQPIIASLTTFIVVAGSLFAYVSPRKGIIAAKQQGRWFDDIETIIAGRVAQSRFPQKLRELTTPRFPWIWVLGSLLAISASVVFVLTHWSEIPDVIPTHWNGSMEADAWSEKSVGSVFFATWVGLGMLALLAGVASTIQWAHVHNRSDRSIKGSIRTAANLAGTNTALGVLIFMLCVPTAFLQVVSVVPQYMDLLPFAFTSLLICAALGSVIVLAIVYVTISRADDALQGIEFGDESELESPDNDKFYKLGMFYYNPDDPAVMVEKRFGTGIDFNYAHWQGKVFLTFVLLVLVGSLSLPFLL
ncbi:hypothetical protein CUROG_09110 [Corynebacterium urogenitale]|uniref:DUF1648 domain-containing protein n=1 Tax=Corynebacterium urogenitale TaxID=2487892 RepID=A0A5J6Z877_9CORY|nr:DUF5808 domain-containing protein [Corynebacterium urogenitale]QFQ03166.1 hypothetical protein CUROG_09110 [Corynebacterium urogenitale]